jgi:hypothetical protein
MIRSSVNVQTPVVTNWRISSGVRNVCMVIVGGGGDRSNPLPEYKESEEIQCPNIILTHINSVPFHALILCRKGIGKIQQLSADSGMSVRNCTIAGIHVGVESGKVVGGSGHGVQWCELESV